MRTSPGAAYDLGYHVVWYPKDRRAVLGVRIKDRLEELIRAKADKYGGEVVACGVMADHVHVVGKPSPKTSPSCVVGRFEGFTSRHLRAGDACLRSWLPMLWSRSCFVAMVGAVSAQRVRRCIATRHERVPQSWRARA